MAHAGQELEGPNGYRLRLIRTAAETDGALLEMEVGYAGDGFMPPEHYHPSQAERFTVLTGAVRTVIAGEARTYEAGESFDIPAGTPHQMGSEVPATARWEVRPALRTADFFERLYGTGPDSPSQTGEWAEFFAEYSEEIRFPD